MKCHSFLEVSSYQSAMTWVDANAQVEVYLPNKYDDNGKRIDSGVPSSSYDENLSSCMVGLNVAKEKIPPGFTEADPETQWNFLANSIKHWSPPQ